MSDLSRVTLLSEWVPHFEFGVVGFIAKLGKVDKVLTNYRLFEFSV